MELTQDAVQVSMKTSRVTLDALKSIIQTMLRNRQRMQQNQHVQHGQQSIRKLDHQNLKLESVSVTDADLRAFKRELNRHSVDFAIKKDSQTGEHKVFFKARDVDRVYIGLENCMKGLSAEMERGKKGMTARMEAARQKAAEQTTPDRQREKVANIDTRSDR